MSTIKTETLSTPSNATVPVDTVVNGTAKAWVNFNGQGTVAIRRAFNVASITDVGTGQYRVNFTNAMADTNYAVVNTVSGYSDATEFVDSRMQGLGIALSTAYASVSSKHPAATAWYDVYQMNVAIFS